ncbi:MAG: hypothetical protein LBJ61_08250 [Deltaproteobacteria bacterium]|jgi:hypothetical protein|nr:hypothetical protein [Deltaproteobacteria bacterium]
MPKTDIIRFGVSGYGDFADGLVCVRSGMEEYESGKYVAREGRHHG